MTLCDLLDQPVGDDESAPLANFVYHEIRAELARRGIPPGQVAFIQEYSTRAKRAALYDALNRGDIRVLIASKQSTGMNVQQRMIALHHLDCPWRPGDLEQREGRIIRQGNPFPEAMVLAYVTEGSFDAFSWQTVETKAGFIEQMKRGDVTMREVEDIGEAVLSAAEIKAIASGNPLIMEKVKLEMRLQQLEAGEAADRTNRLRLRRTLVTNAAERTRLSARRPLLLAAQTEAQQSAGQPFRAAIVRKLSSAEATTFTKRDIAGDAVLSLLETLGQDAQRDLARQTHSIGRYRGCVLYATAFTNGTTELTLRYAHAGALHPLNATTISAKTAMGVFASIDSMLRSIDRDITILDRFIADLDTETTTIQTMLATPWEQAIALRAARERLEQINAALDRTEPNDPSAAPAAGSAENDAVMMDAEDTDTMLGGSSMERPLVLLPEPANLMAMQAAMQQLCGSLPADALEPAQEESLASIDAAAHTANAQLQATLHLPAITLIEPLPIPHPRLIFGRDQDAVAARKRKKAAPPPMQQASLFALLG